MHLRTSINTVVTVHCHMSRISISALYSQDELAGLGAVERIPSLAAPSIRRDAFNTVQC